MPKGNMTCQTGIFFLKPLLFSMRDSLIKLVHYYVPNIIPRTPCLLKNELREEKKKQKKRRRQCEIRKTLNLSSWQNKKKR